MTLSIKECERLQGCRSDGTPAARIADCARHELCGWANPE